MNKITTVALTVIVLTILFFTVFGSHGVVHLLLIDKEIAALEKKNEELNVEIANINNELYAVQNDRFTLEKKSREELGLSKPGEKVYLFPDRNKRDSSRSKDTQPTGPKATASE